jgi:hypothetical protein
MTESIEYEVGHWPPEQLARCVAARKRLLPPIRALDREQKEIMLTLHESICDLHTWTINEVLTRDEPILAALAAYVEAQVDPDCFLRIGSFREAIELVPRSLVELLDRLAEPDLASLEELEAAAADWAKGQTPESNAIQRLGNRLIAMSRAADDAEGRKIGEWRPGEQ